MYRLPLWSFAILCLLVSTASAEESPQATSATIPSDAPIVLAKFRVARHGDLLMIPVSIHGGDHQFMLDTGAMSNVLDVSLADEFGPLKRSSRKYPKATPPMYEMPKANLTGTDLAVTGDLAIYDMEQLRHMSGYNIRGILGMTFLEGRIIELDFDEGTVAFLKSVAPMDFKPLQLSRDAAGHPTLDLKIEPSKLSKFVIDTGMAVPGTGEMSSEHFDALLNSKHIKLVGPPPRVLRIDGVVTTRSGKIDVFKFGEFEHRNIRVISGSVDGLGLRYLSRYKVTLDLAGNRAYFVPGKRFAAPSVFDASGMIISRVKGATLIDKVHPSGPAAAAGVRVGDVLTRFNGLDADEHSLFTLRQLLSHPDQTISLSLKRADEDFQCPLMLKNWQAEIPQP